MASADDEDWGSSIGSADPQRDRDRPVNDEPDDWGSSGGASEPHREPARGMG